MATTVKGAFAEYKTNLQITDRQESLVSTRRTNVVNALARSLELSTSGPSYVIGSWDRQTLTRFLSEGDIDVMVVLHYGKNKGWDNADGTIKALDRFKSILQAENAYKSTPMRRDRNCVTMQFSEFRLDVIPAFQYEGGYYSIPDSYQKKWLETDPFSFASRITDVNKTMDSTFVPLIKMVKGWNRQAGWPIRSFHLECLLYHHYRTYYQSYTYDSTLQGFFSKLPTYLDQACCEPVRSERVDTYLDNDAVDTRRAQAIRKAEAAKKKSQQARDASDANNIARSINTWQSLFGDFFPAYG